MHSCVGPAGCQGRAARVCLCLPTTRAPSSALKSRNLHGGVRSTAPLWGCRFRGAHGWVTAGKVWAGGGVRCQEKSWRCSVLRRSCSSDRSSQTPEQAPGSVELPKPSLKAWVAAPLAEPTGRPGEAVLAPHDRSHRCHRAAPCSRQARPAVPSTHLKQSLPRFHPGPNLCCCSFQLLSLLYAFCKALKWQSKLISSDMVLAKTTHFEHGLALHDTLSRPWTRRPRSVA